MVTHTYCLLIRKQLKFEEIVHSLHVYCYSGKVLVFDSIHSTSSYILMYMLIYLLVFADCLHAGEPLGPAQ